MIYVLYGEDTEASYLRLIQIATQHPNHAKINLIGLHTWADLYLNLFSEDLVESQKLIICENFLKDKKLNFSTDGSAILLKGIPEDKTVIFHEKWQVPNFILAKIRNTAKVENFKPKATLFWFLDSLSPQARTSIREFAKLPQVEQENLIWSLNFRLLLLILAKLEMSKVEAQKVAARSLFDWQWQKINAQAKSFSLPVLQGLFTGTLRVDFLIKSGATSFGARDLIPLVLLKYLSH